MGDAVTWWRNLSIAERIEVCKAANLSERVSELSWSKMTKAVQWKVVAQYEEHFGTKVEVSRKHSRTW